MTALTEAAFRAELAESNRTARQQRIAQRREKVQRLHGQGHSSPFIASLLGVSTDTVKTDLRQLGLKPHGKVGDL